MRRVVLSIAIAASLLAVPAFADGDAMHRTSELRLPAHQNGVIVTTERGVRVWRPVTTAYAAVNGAYSDADSTNYDYGTSYAPAYGGYGDGLGYGWGLPYGYGYGHGDRPERRYGMNPFVASHPALARFYRGHRGLSGHAPVLVHGFPNGPVHPRVTINVNLGSGFHGGAGRLAWAGPHGPAPMRGFTGGHFVAHGGGHRGGHR